MTRSPWVLPKPGKAYPAGDETAGLHHAGLAAGQPRDAAGVDGVARRGQRVAAGEVRHLPRAAGRVRGALAPAGRRGLERRILRPADRVGPGSELTRDESIRPGSTPETAGCAQARLPAERDDHRRERLAAERRRLGGAARVGERGRNHRVRARWPGSPGRGSHGAGAAGLRLRAGRGGQPGPARRPGSTGPTSVRSS